MHRDVKVIFLKTRVVSGGFEIWTWLKGVCWLITCYILHYLFVTLFPLDYMQFELLHLSLAWFRLQVSYQEYKFDTSLKFKLLEQIDIVNLKYELSWLL